MKEKLVEFLKPDKRKVILTLFLPIMWFIFGLILTKLNPPEGFMVWPGVNLGLVSVLLFSVSYLLEALFFYPFACSTIKLWDTFKAKRIGDIGRDRTVLGLVIIGILVFNPITLNILLLSPFILSSMFKPNQGLYVIDVVSDSPADKRGEWTEGKVIVGLNNTRVINTNDALKILEKSKQGDWLMVETSGGSTGSIQVGSHPDFTRGYLGIKVRDSQGNEAIL